MLLQPKVSIGIPTYNRPEGLEKQLNYLIKQEYKNIEIIISDNCSTDLQVKSILEKYSEIDDRIRYFIQSRNIEIEPNFNFVYRQAKSKYFMWMADDDRFSSNYISACVEFLEENDDFVLCSGISIYFRNDTLLFKEKIISLEQNIALIRLINYFLTVFKNGVFYGVYKIDERFDSPIQKNVGSDWCHVARTALLGKIKTLTQCECHRSDEGGSSNRAKIVSRWNAAGVKKVFFETFTAYQIVINLFSETIIKKRYNYISRLFIQSLIFVLLNFKFLIKSISRRLKFL